MKPLRVTRRGFNPLVGHRFFSNRDHIKSCVFSFLFFDYDKITFNIFVLVIDLIRGYQVSFSVKTRQNFFSTA